jgi:hypothetical protein
MVIIINSIIRKIMDIKLLNEIKTIIVTMAMCAFDNCKETRKKINDNLKIEDKFKNAMFENDVNKKNKLLTEIYKNKLVYNYNKCIIKNCKIIYNDFLDKIEKIISIPQFPKNKKEQINNYLKDIKTIFKSKKTNIKTINIIIKNSEIIGKIINKIK